MKNTFALLLASTSLLATAASAEMLALEKEELTFGFIKLTDMAPLAVAYELGYFEDEGLFVRLEAQANWKVLLDGVIDGQLDGAHMLAGQPLAATIGYGTKAHIITPFSMDLNGNAITVSNDIWDEMKPNVPTMDDGRPQHPISASALAPVVEGYKDRGEPFNMGMVFPVSTHNYEIRYWMASAGIDPDKDVRLIVIPPPQMVANLQARNIVGYCVGEPWNQRAVEMGIGRSLITNYEIWNNNPEKVFGVNKAWADKHPNTHKALIRAMIEAAQWMNKLENRREVVKIISQKINQATAPVHDVRDGFAIQVKIHPHVMLAYGLDRVRHGSLVLMRLGRHLLVQEPCSTPASPAASRRTADTRRCP